MKIIIGAAVLILAIIIFLARKMFSDKNPDFEIEKNYVNRVMSRYKN